jgi:hypothetical protein
MGVIDASHDVVHLVVIEHGLVALVASHLGSAFLGS